MKKILLPFAIVLLMFSSCKKDETTIKDEIGYKFISYSKTGHVFIFNGVWHNYEGNNKNETVPKEFKIGDIIIEVKPTGKENAYLEVYKDGAMLFKGNSNSAVHFHN